jgi:sigma-54-specific transcriptional regulator
MDMQFKTNSSLASGSTPTSPREVTPTRNDDATVLTSKSAPQTHSIRASALVFCDPASRQLLDYLERVGPSEATVLIQGDTGTGKELVAHHVHELSNRRKGPFVAVNCAALSESLLDAELFGHVKGAFTGAHTDRPGWFETSHGGTLFLDEIGDLPHGAQVKLLRVLQQREVVRVGARAPIPVDFRLVAATNVDLKAAVEAGHFRADLYYRLSVAEIRLPPLRERPGDIAPLVEHFLRIYGQRLGYGEVSIDPAAMTRLQSYGWPGNIRELENVIHHTLLVCPGSAIRQQDIHLPDRPQIAGEMANSPETRLQQAVWELLARSTPDLHALSERTLIETAYRYCGQNQIQTANALGISRNVLRERLQRLDIIPYPPSRRT